MRLSVLSRAYQDKRAVQSDDWQFTCIFKLGRVWRKKWSLEKKMNEIDILKLFYDEMKVQSVTRDQVFLSMEDDAAAALSQKLNTPVSVEVVQRLTDTCIANEWLERTTADIHYKYLSLTEAGLQMVLLSEYR